MSRGFRDADATQEQSGREAGEAIRRLRSLDEEQARHAAERREQGVDGRCESCGGPIGEERLAALPDATRCVRCQATWEAAN